MERDKLLKKSYLPKLQTEELDRPDPPEISPWPGMGTSIGHKLSWRDSQKQKTDQLKIQHEELTELYKKCGELEQQVISLNHQMEQKDREMQVKEAKSDQCQETISKLETEWQELRGKLQDLETTKQILQDDYDVLQITFNCQAEKLKRTNKENQELLAKCLAEETGPGYEEAWSDSQKQEMAQLKIQNKEKLTELHNKYKELEQQVTDLKNQMKRKDRVILIKESEIAEGRQITSTHEAECQKLRSKVQGLERAKQTLKDEYEALDIVFEVQKEKLRKTSEEHKLLVARWIATGGQATGWQEADSFEYIE